MKGGDSGRQLLDGKEALRYEGRARRHRNVREGFAMLEQVDVGVVEFAVYEPYIDSSLAQEVRALAGKLKGCRIAHINATPFGGGVSELLRSAVPIYCGLGIEADWLLISGDPDFFTITKSFHNALQGARINLTGLARDTYLAYNRLNAEQLDQEYDFIIVHDPQPLAIRHFKGKDRAKWIWRCHIDTSSPHEEVLLFLRGYFDEYDALVFTMREFVPPIVEHRRLEIIAPAIDPLSPKNMSLPDDMSRMILTWLGVNPRRPLLAQISRFDPWKDPLGVVEAFNLVRKEMPGLQLALLAAMALDDPQGWDMHKQVTEATKGDPDIHVRTSLVGVGDVEVNAFQRLSTVILQKSIREGFGLVISESLWKGTPVVANRAGGIPLQMEDGVGGYLVDSTEQMAERALFLLNNPQDAKAVGRAGHERVRERFLTPRLIRDELRLLASL
jgi:trehalose synthase